MVVVVVKRKLFNNLLERVNQTAFDAVVILTILSSFAKTSPLLSIFIISTLNPYRIRISPLIRDQQIKLILLEKN